jgi:hypothetical protein
MYTNSQKIGDEIEDLFKKTVIKHNFNIQVATLNQNKYEHWDFRIIKKKFNITVDVKAAKKINRHDNKSNDTVLCIELKNVCGGTGWIYGEADYISFCNTDKTKFFCVKRKDLVLYIHNNINMNTSIPTTSHKKLNTVYNRSQYLNKYTNIPNKDEFVFISINILKIIPHFILDV